METTKELLEESLDVMRERYRNPEHTTRDIFQGDELGTKHVKRLVGGGYLRKIIDGWYYVPFDRTEEDETEWYMFYWSFVVAYLDRKYGEDWCLGADDSLVFLSGNGVLPRQLIVRSPLAGGTILSLPLDFELLEIEADVPDEAVREKRYGLRIFPLHLALLKASPGFYRSHPREARVCLALLEDEQPLLDTAVHGGYCRGACKVAGGLRSIGELTMPDIIIDSLRRYGYDAEPENPFLQGVEIPQEKTAVVSLVRLLWKEMRDEVAEIPHNFCISPSERSVADIMDMTERAFVTDAINSLDLSGYCVTREMAERASDGRPDDGEEPATGQDIDDATVQAYHDAFRQARTDIIDSLTGGEEPATMINLVEDWHASMQSSLRSMHATRGGEVNGYRKEDFPVLQSTHVPAEAGAVPEAMKVLSQLITGEKNAFVRALLGHFFLIYIHPFTENNGVIARLFMNSQLVAAGYPWTVIPGWKGEMYEAALEKACTKGDIQDLAHLVAESIYRDDITVKPEE